MSLYDFMFNSSSSLHQPWFIDASTGRALTGSTVKRRTDALALGLSSTLALGVGAFTSSTQEAHRECGIRDVVGVVSPNSMDFGTVVWAAHRLGCTVACIGGGSTADEIKQQFALSGTRTVFAHIDSLERVISAAEECHIPCDRIVVISDAEDQELPPDFETSGMLTVEALIRVGEGLSTGLQASVEPSPIAFLCFSSGTTGLPKAVIVPHSSIIANVNQVKRAAVPGIPSPGSNEKALGVIPFSHMFGLVTLVHLCPHIGIATVAFKLMPPFKVFLETIVRLQINHLFLAPPLVNAFVKHPATPAFDLTFLRSAMIAAAPLSSDIESTFRNIGGPDFLVTQGFGMTECGGLITGLPSGRSPRPGSVGQLMSSTDAKIVDAESGVVVPAGTRGHLCVRGPQVCPGYLGNAAATREAFDAEGFLRTGDIAFMSSDGYFYIVDRLKYMIKNKGYQVSPAELEAHLLSLDVVQDAGVIGKPDERCGEVPVAFVVLSPIGRQREGRNLEAIKEEIMRTVRETKSEYKWLHDVFFVESIPRLPSGKIISKQLKAMLDGTHLADVVVLPSTNTAASSPWSAPVSVFFEMTGLISAMLKRGWY